MCGAVYRHANFDEGWITKSIQNSLSNGYSVVLQDSLAKIIDDLRMNGVVRNTVD